MHPIENIMKSSMEQIKGMVDVNTIVGDPIVVDANTMIVPVSKVSLGFHSGGGEYNCSDKKKNCTQDSSADLSRFPFAGTAAAGMSITPMAFVSVSSGDVSIKPVQYDCTVDRLVELIPRVLNSVKEMCCGKKAEQQNECEKECVTDTNTEYCD
ncbi:MAG: GerW family sporulation protein [Clostridia bacterium]|nr:GerW family sporulation protein [Clostridia bacterium]